MSDHRLDTKGRARALQMLYAWEIDSRIPLEYVTRRVAHLIRPAAGVTSLAAAHAGRVVANVGQLDRRAAAASENWRWDRVGMIERNILRLAIQELEDGSTPPRVVIDEAVRLARWFGGTRAPAFINGVLDRVARDLGRLD